MTARLPMDGDHETNYNDLMTTTIKHQPTIRLRFTVVNQPNGRPDRSVERDIPTYDDPFGAGPVAYMLRNSPAGTAITQTEGDYVRTWTLL